MRASESLGRDLERFLGLLQAEWGDDLISVVLFGSHARGQARPESDIDLLIVKKHFPRSRLERQKLLCQLDKKIGMEFATALSPILLTPEEAQVIKPYYLGLLSSHAILFDRDQFFARILKRLEERLVELGAERRFDPDGYEYWVLKKDAQLGEEIIL